jgi:hypothetical protein
MLEMLKDRDIQKALKNSSESDDKLMELLKEVDTSDDDDIISVSKKYSQKIKELVNYFNGKLSETEEKAVAKAKASDVAKEEAKIAEFAKKNPGMNNAEVVAMMQPLYDKGKPIEECYAAACKAMDINPTSGKSLADDPIKPVDDKEKGKDKPKPDEAKKITSARSVITGGDEGGDDAGGEGGETKPKSIDEIISANINRYKAEHGDPNEATT